MKATILSAMLAGGVMLAAPAFADSVTIQSDDHAGVAVSPPVAAVPDQAGQTTIEKDKIKKSDDGTKSEEKRTRETITPEGSSRTTTTTKSVQDND